MLYRLMKTITAILPWVWALSGLLLSYGCSSNLEPLVFHVAPAGASGQPGTKAQPFGSIEEAQRAIRTLRQKGALQGRPVQVYLHAGHYPVSDGLLFEAVDGGSEAAPVRWSAYPGDEVTLSGGVAVADWRPLSPGPVADRLTAEARDQVQVATVPPELLARPGDLNPQHGDRPQLYVGARTFSLARYPDEGDWLRIAAVPQSGGTKYVRDPNFVIDGIPAGQHFGRFQVEDPRIFSWENTENIWMNGFWAWNWAQEYQRLAHMEASQQIIFPAAPFHKYGYRAGQRFYLLNALEALDAPGEWYLDPKQGQIYAWFPDTLPPQQAWMPLPCEPLLTVRNAQHLSFSSLRFECGRGEGIRVAGGRDVQIQDCEFLNLGKEAVVLAGGWSHQVADCHLHRLQAGGILIQGGDRGQLLPGGHRAVNNHIHHFAQQIKTYQPAIRVEGVGNWAQDNHIHDAPHIAISFSGNDHQLRGNKIHAVCLETGDAGAIYAGRDWTQRGTVIADNHLYDLGPKVDDDGYNGVIAVYLDDCLSGIRVENNLFEQVSLGVMLGGGHDLLVRNNVFLDCGSSVYVDARAMTWADRFARPGGAWRMYLKMVAFDPKKEPWSAHYPGLAARWRNPVPPTNVRIEGNLSQGRRWLGFLPRIDFQVIEARNNVVADSELLLREFSSPEDVAIYSREDSALVDTLRLYGNQLLPAGSLNRDSLRRSRLPQ